MTSVWYQCSNGSFNFDDVNGAMERRVILLPFKSLENKDICLLVSTKWVHDKWVLEWIASQTIAHHAKVIDRDFTKPTGYEELIKQATNDNNFYYGFFKECIESLLLLFDKRFPTKLILVLACYYGDYDDRFFIKVTPKALKDGLESTMRHTRYQGCLGKEKVEYLQNYKEDTPEGKLIGKLRPYIDNRNYNGVFIKKD